MACFAGPAGGQTLVDHYVRAMQARAVEDFPTYLEEIRTASELEPGHAVLQFHLGRAYAQNGEPDDALAWLERAYRQGAWVDAGEDPWLEPLRTETGWSELLALADSVGTHHGPGAIGFELDEFDLMPEGIEYDSVTDRFVLGSAKRKILLTDREGRSEEFVAPRQDGLLAVLGVRVDEDRRRLWSVSVGDPTMTELDSLEIGASRLHCWSLEDGRLLGRWDAPADSLAHGFNDLALLPDGSVVLTDPSAGAIYGAKLDDSGLREIVPPASLRGPNGIAISEDGTVAWVAEYVYGVARVDLETGKHVAVAVPEQIALVGVDGLYLRGDELIANDPTTGVIVDGELWYIANSNLAGFDIRQMEPDPEVWGTVLILRAPL
jgi:hypothetical protein